MTDNPVAWQVYNPLVKDWTRVYHDNAKVNQMKSQGAIFRPLYAQPTPDLRAAVGVKPLDLAMLLKHALEAGKAGIEWEDYDPDNNAAYYRIVAALAARMPEPGEKEGG